MRKKSFEKAMPKNADEIDPRLERLASDKYSSLL
jgi:hypothetical protein